MGVLIEPWAGCVACLSSPHKNYKALDMGRCVSILKFHLLGLSVVPPR